MSISSEEELIKYVLDHLNDVYVDYPFDESKYGTCPVFKHNKSNKWFGIFMKMGEDIYLNVKTKPEYSELLRKTNEYIIPGYHMNKQHWNSIIINKIDDLDLVKELINESYELTK